MPLNNRGLLGQPVLQYVDYRVYANSDVFLDLTFLDHTQSFVLPSAATYEIDDLTNGINMFPQTSIAGISNPAAYTNNIFTLQIPGSVMVMTRNWQGSQLCQIWVSATVTDSVTSSSSVLNNTVIVELVAIQTPST